MGTFLPTEALCGISQNCGFLSGNVRIPGATTRVELVDFRDIDRRPVQPRLQTLEPIDMQGLRVALVRELNNLFLVTWLSGNPRYAVGNSYFRVRMIS